MAELPQTYAVLAEMSANRHFGLGQHAEHVIRSTAIGRQLGHTAFDALLHTPDQIDPFSLMGMALEQDMVPMYEPARPLLMNIVTDMSAQREHPSVTLAKRRVSHDISAAIDDTLEATDQAFLYLVGDNIPERGMPYHEIISVPQGDKEALGEKVSQIALDGLTFVVSDFNRLKLPEHTHFDELVAVKVNHVLERKIPEGFNRVISLGGLGEIDATSKRKVTKANAYLEEMHQKTVSELKSHGVHVASVIVSPKQAQIYDVSPADAGIATALRKIYR